MKSLALALIFVSGIASARSVQLPDVSPELRGLQVTEISEFGHVLKETKSRPFTSFIVGLPVEVSTGNACTTFVGQQTKRSGKIVSVMPVGATNRLNDACIEVMPEPVHVQLTVEMNVLTGGFVPADRIQRQLVKIEGVGTKLIELDIHNKTVKIGHDPRATN